MEKRRHSGKPLSRQAIMRHLNSMLAKGTLFSKNGLFSIESPGDADRKIPETIHEPLRKK